MNSRQKAKRLREVVKRQLIELESHKTNAKQTNELLDYYRVENLHLNCEIFDCNKSISEQQVHIEKLKEEIKRKTFKGRLKELFS